MKISIGELLLLRLEQVGIKHILGVPGDYNLELMQQLEDRGTPEWIGNCNELNASYAADGYARIAGLSAMIVTHGVGALSALNGIAGAYCEHVPVICICGSLPLRSSSRSLLMHHTMADGSRDGFLRAFQQFTIAQAQLTPQNAAGEIDRLILTAWQLKRPVYMELPSDIAFLEVEAIDEPLKLLEPVYDVERVTTCAERIAKRLDSARAPAMLLDLDADRFGVRQEVKDLADKMKMPVATLASSKDSFSEQSPLFAGTYSGAASDPTLRKAIEESDCLLTIGFRRVDSTSAFFTDSIPTTTIHLNAFAVDTGDEYFEGITLRAVLERVISHVTSRDRSLPVHREGQLAKPIAGSQSLTQKEYWNAMQAFLRPHDIILAEDGTSSSGGSALALPEGCTFITQAIWGSIGYTLGSLLGTMLAAPDRRHILFIGDGSFQLTAQELSTILRHGLRPYIFLINNGGYTIERTILGKSARYNDVANWSYADLPEVFARQKQNTLVIRTADDLVKALAAVDGSFMLCEIVMQANDAPVGLIKGGHASADVDYGPRGPQHRQGAQIAVSVVPRVE